MSGAHEHHHEHPTLPEAETGNSRRLFMALTLTAAFMVVEAGGGILAHSLALIADAGHMLTDSASLFLAWLAVRAARRPADEQRSYGYERFQVLAAFINGVVLLGLSVWIVAEAMQRLVHPPEVAGGIMVVIAAIGMLVNAGMFWLLHHGDHDDLNLRAAILHVLGDLLGSAAAVVAGAVILATGWMPIDPLLSILVALLILRSAWRLTRESGHILLEGVPGEATPAALEAAVLDAVPEVRDVHHVHAWSLTGRRPMVTLHARLTDGADSETALRAIHNALAARFGVRHVTVQIEYGACMDGHAATSTHRHH